VGSVTLLSPSGRANLNHWTTYVSVTTAWSQVMYSYSYTNIGEDEVGFCLTNQAFPTDGVSILSWWWGLSATETLRAMPAVA
jgi:hypothetical protein